MIHLVRIHLVRQILGQKSSLKGFLLYLWKWGELSSHTVLTIIEATITVSHIGLQIESKKTGLLSQKYG